MSRIIIIGGSGHVGTYLVPRLVRAGHEVVNVSRGSSSPYHADPTWRAVRTVELDREKEDAAGTFGGKIADLDPDIVIDKICFTLDSARQLAEALRGRVQHLLHTGTIWVHGHCVTAPTTEDDPRAPYGDYGVWKSEIENYLIDQSRRGGVPATVFRVGHIVGPGWAPLNPAGHFNPAAFDTIARGEKLSLPNMGLETVHHVHADDIAQMYTRAISNWSVAAGEVFNTVSPAAVTLRGYAEAMYTWCGHTPNLDFQPFETWAKGQSEDDAAATLEHIARSPSHSIDKARRRLGYAPRYSSLEAVQESVAWLQAEGKVAKG